MPNPDEIKYQQDLLETNRRTLAVLLNQRAALGAAGVAQNPASIAAQAEVAVAQVLAAGNAEQRASLITQLENVAQQAEAGKEAGSPWLALAVRLRELAGRLVGR